MHRESGPSHKLNPVFKKYAREAIKVVQSQCGYVKPSLLIDLPIRARSPLASRP
jgi:hypothetical protein